MNDSGNNVAELTENLPHTAPPAAQEDPRLVQLLEEYRALLEAGHKPDRQPYLDRFPELAASLNDCFDGLEFVFTVAPDLKESAGQAATKPAAGTLGASVPLGDYRIVREIGRGGMGVVYEAEQMLLGRHVALKVLPFAATMDARQLQRFQNEARAAACLHHPHIVPVYAVGCERGVHYYAMQFIEGQSLAQVIADLRLQNAGSVAGAEVLRSPGPPAKNPPANASPVNAGASEYLSPGHPAVSPVPKSTICNPQSAIADTPPLARLSTELSLRGTGYFRAVARLGIQGAEALQHAHELGVIHRDIKPANLMVDGRGNAWVTDFGLAQIQGDNQLTLSGDLVGTLRYMSPEQALAKRVLIDHRTDIYSLGSTLYELLTLEPVFTGADRQELLRQIAFEEPKSPRRHNKSIPAELETILLKALEKNPAERYATAQELAEDLERFVKDEPIRARRPSLLQIVRKLYRRQKLLFWSVTVALGVIITVVAASVGYVARDYQGRLTKIEQNVAEALGGARTAIQTGDLKLAEHRLAEANGHLGTERDNLPDQANDIRRLQREIKARQGDDARFHQFLKLANAAQYEIDLLGDSGDVSAEPVAKKALDVYGVLSGNDWLARLDKVYLTAGQKEQVRETAYLTLVSLADWCVRMYGRLLDPKEQVTETRLLKRCLDLLRQAETFHEPTRAFYFVRGACQRALGNLDAAAEDAKLFQAAVARTAWDHFLPGQTAAWNGNYHEAIRCYQAALESQYDHYNSLFFLAVYLVSDEINRPVEAIGYLSACLALRPDDLNAHLWLAKAYQAAGQLEKAENAYSAAVKRAKPEAFGHRELCLRRRSAFYESVGKIDKAQEDRRRIVETVLEALKHDMKKHGPDHPATIHTTKVLASYYAFDNATEAHKAIALLQPMVERRNRLKVDERLMSDILVGLGSSYLARKQYVQAEPHLREGLKLREKTRPDHWLRFNALSLLGEALLGQGKFAEAEPLLLQGYEGLQQRIELREDNTPEDLLPRRAREAADRLEELYRAWGKPERWRAEQERMAAGFVRRWLVLSQSIPYAGSDGARAIDTEFLAHEEEVKPRKGDMSEVGGKRLTWQEHEIGRNHLDFTSLYGRPTHNRVAYAACFVQSNSDRNDLVLRVGSDDQAKVYINGRPVYRSLKMRALVIDQDQVPISLHQGNNVVIFKVANVAHGWFGSLRILDKDGRAADGLRFGIAPD